MNHYTKKQAFTLTELMVVVAIILVLAVLVAPSFSSMFADYRQRSTAADIEGVLTKAMSYSVANGTQTRVSIKDNQLFAETSNDGVNFTPIPKASLTLNTDFSFARNSNVATPWLKKTETTPLLPSASGNDYDLFFNNFGLPEEGAVVYLQGRKKSAAIEILASGALRTHVYSEVGKEWGL